VSTKNTISESKISVQLFSSQLVKTKAGISKMEDRREYQPIAKKGNR
jgi:hypothetical protein